MVIVRGAHKAWGTSNHRGYHISRQAVLGGEEHKLLIIVEQAVLFRQEAANVQAISLRCVQARHSEGLYSVCVCVDGPEFDWGVRHGSATHTKVNYLRPCIPLASALPVLPNDTVISHWNRALC